ncbi:EcsC family protein [Bacillus piscicola]|uniref:EcsC family protein n=1 Tax=Bacillus piscicola TaxID=1632684 RepID=UPI001F0978AE|nr:EcsC family protein [Bacillus piscicola]
MEAYEQKAYEEVQVWLRKMEKRASMSQAFAKSMQTKMNRLVPTQIHSALGQAVRQMINGVLNGSDYLPTKKQTEAKSLQEADGRLENLVTVFQKGAAAEGAGTGAGGLLLGAVDFPLLLAFKMRFLFSAAGIYGVDSADLHDRLYMLYLFQVAFSSPSKRRETVEILKNWSTLAGGDSQQSPEAIEVDWSSFQQEYRDHIDFVKLLQLMPGFGAAVGAAANYHLLGQLGEAAKQGYRLHWLRGKYKDL